MAAVGSLTTVQAFTNTVLAILVTDVNVYLATFQGGGQAGNANQYKFIQAVQYQVVYDGTDINYSAMVTVVNTMATVS